jgi:hypothetical protein
MFFKNSQASPPPPPKKGSDPNDTLIFPTNGGQASPVTDLLVSYTKKTNLFRGKIPLLTAGQ